MRGNKVDYGRSCVVDRKVPARQARHRLKTAGPDDFAGFCKAWIDAVGGRKCGGRVWTVNPEHAGSPGSKPGQSPSDKCRVFGRPAHVVLNQFDWYTEIVADLDRAPRGRDVLIQRQMGLVAHDRVEAEPDRFVNLIPGDMIEVDHLVRI